MATCIRRGALAHVNRLVGELVDILTASDDRYVPAASLGLGGGETDQLAAAITGGYRARFPVFATDGADARRNGMYVAANYHYLYGLRFDSFDARLQLDTDSNGLLTPDPPETPFALDWNTTRDGNGLALDFGVAFVRNRWDFGAGVGGVANRITWKNIRKTAGHLYRRRLLSQGEVVPLRTRAVSRATMSAPAWSTRLGGVELRGAGRISQGNWYPSAGAGFNLTRNFGVDAAVFGTKTFLEPSAHLGLALSFRIDKGRPSSPPDPVPTQIPQSGSGS